LDIDEIPGIVVYEIIEITIYYKCLFSFGEAFSLKIGLVDFIG
jgi:hypothetical protein